MPTSKKTPHRMCVGCREMKEKRELIRVLHTADGAFVIDSTGKGNGRGAYLCKNPDCLGKAVQNHGLERSFHAAIPKETFVGLQRELASLIEQRDK